MADRHTIALRKIKEQAITFGYQADKVSAQDNEQRFDRLADVADLALGTDNVITEADIDRGYKGYSAYKEKSDSKSINADARAVIRAILEGFIKP